MSPSRMPSFDAVAGLISIQLLHIAEVRGSGISCSHGRCASDPSRNALDEYGRKCSGYCATSPANTSSGNGHRQCPCWRQRWASERRWERAPPAALLLRIGPRVERRRRRQRRNRSRSAAPRSSPTADSAGAPAVARRRAARQVWRASGAAASSPAARHWPRPPSNPIPATPPTTTRGMSDRAGSGPTAMPSRRGSCRNSRCTESSRAPRAHASPSAT